MSACGTTYGQTPESGSRSLASAYLSQERRRMGSGAAAQQAAAGHAHSSGRCLATSHPVLSFVDVSVLFLRKAGYKKLRAPYCACIRRQKLLS